MTKLHRIAFALAASVAVAGCASTPAPGPVEVTRFHDAAALAAAHHGTVFVVSAPGAEEDSLAQAPYKAAVAAELAKLGFSEAGSEGASLIAQVRVEHFRIGGEEKRRGPVSVGVGGSTGSYGSGVGLGIGINLGGSRSSERLGTELGVMLRDKASGQTVWEGRARFTVSPKSELADPAQGAAAIAGALFRDFPGNNGETIEIEVAE